MAQQILPITIEEYATYFANDFDYHDFNESPKWTYLIFKYELWESNGTQIEQPCALQEYRQEHKEMSMIRTIREIFEEPEAQRMDVTIYLSYSPCLPCAKEILKLKDELERVDKIIDIRLKFSAFYFIKDPWTNKIKHTGNANGLVNLIRNGVELAIFYGDSDWWEFLDDIGVPNTVNNVYTTADGNACYAVMTERQRWFAIARTQRRMKREEVDRNIMQQIREYAET